MNSVDKLNPLLILGLLLFFINNVPGLGGNIGRQAPTVLMIIIGAFLLVFYMPKSISLKSAPFFFLFIYGFYVIANNLIHGYIDSNQLIINDFAEPLRVLGVLLFFILGASCYSLIKRKDLRFFLNLYLIISLLLILGWVLGRAFSFGLFDFYITRGGRYSGILASVNYVWVSSIIFIGIVIVHYNNVQLNKRDLLIFILVIFVSIISILLSGGRASILGFLLGTMLLVLFCGKKARSVTLLFISVLVIFLSILIYFFSGNIFSQLERTFSRMEELYIALQNIDIGQVAAFDARLHMWERAWVQINESLMFGHGSRKAGIRVIDNTYLMTLYRYGIVGLFLEIMIYFSFLIIAVKKVAKNNLYLLPIAFIVAYFVTGFTSSPFYELKTPYILSFLIGWFTTVEPKFQQKLNDKYFNNQ